MLSLANTRLKDYYDIWVLARSHNCGNNALARAIAATFKRRKTPIPAVPPDGLTLAFAEDAAKQRKWSSFLEDVAVNPGPLSHVVEELAAFLMPHALQARGLQNESE